MQSVTKYRFVFVLSLVIAVIVVECLGWEGYAHYAVIGFCIYFLIVAILILFFMLLNMWGRRIARKQHFREWGYQDPRRKQALGRIKRDINRLSKYN